MGYAGEANPSQKKKYGGAMGKKTTPPGFLTPEDERPDHGPYYAVNATNTLVMLPRNTVHNLPEVALTPWGTRDCIQVVAAGHLDTPAFQRLWADGRLKVTTSSKAAAAYTAAAKEKRRISQEREKQVEALVFSRDTSGDIVITETEDGIEYRRPDGSSLAGGDVA